MNGELLAVSARLIVITLCPGLAYKLNKIVVAYGIFGKHNKVVAVIAFVFLVSELLAPHTSHTPK